MVERVCVSPWLIEFFDEVSDLKDSPFDFSFMVHAESLLVASEADDGCLVGLLE